MDNFESSNLGDENLDNSIPLDSGSDDLDGGGVSHAPLDLGGSRTVEIPKVDTPKPKQVTQKPVENVATTERIIGVRTFFTKLHPGAINFLDEQITEWLKKNPGITIKRTNVTVGEIQAKKTEPNILITVWY